jgi:3-dehydroquinate synthase
LKKCERREGFKGEKDLAERVVRVNASKSYDVIISKGSINKAGEYIKKVFPSLKNAVIVSDDNVFPLYGEAVKKTLNENEIRALEFVVPHGEKSKDITVLSQLLEFLAENKVDKKSVLLALGGGVIGDLTGFAASCYLRGIEFVQIPTTLLAAVDSSVGGKTAVNLKAGKNLAGAFWQPSLVICDPETFNTLSPSELANGISESVKYGIICDRQLYEDIETNGFTEIEKKIERCVSIKRDIVESDEFDKGKRKLLNLGHTFGHAIEKCSNFEIQHGAAVAIGMTAAAKVSEKLNLSEEKPHDRIKSLLEKLNLPTECRYSYEELYEAALSDKKVESDKISLILIRKIGDSFIYNVSIKELKDIFYIAFGG